MPRGISDPVTQVNWLHHENADSRDSESQRWTTLAALAVASVKHPKRDADEAR